MEKKTFLVLLLSMIVGVTSLLRGQSNNSNDNKDIVMEYRDYKFSDDDLEYKLFEAPVKRVGYSYSETAQKLFVLDDKMNVVVYDLRNVLNKDVQQKTFHLPFNVETTSNTIEASPDGKYLAFVEDNGEYLRVMSSETGSEVASYKLGKKYQNELLNNQAVGNPFAFVSDHEILITGARKALWFDITKKRGETISFEKAYRELPKINVTSRGNILGYDYANRKFTTFFVEKGRVNRTEEWLSVTENINYYEYYYAQSNKFINIDKRTGSELQDREEAQSDRDKYIFKYNSDRKQSELTRYFKQDQQVSGRERRLSKYYLYFPKNGYQLRAWIQNYQVLLLLDQAGVRLYNHTLTDNEMAKQALLAAIDANNVEAINQFLKDFKGSRYTEIAEQKKVDAINNEWLRLSSINDCSYKHAKDVIQFIEKYENTAPVDAAKKELDAVYKGILERIPEDNIPQYNEYINNLPQSPYLDLAREKLNHAQEIKQQQETERLLWGEMEQSTVAEEPKKVNTPPVHNGPEGTLPGEFSVSGSKKVYFSKGNLQYQASTNTWRFAENQWDYVGGSIGRNHYGNVAQSSNDHPSSSYSGWIDLFAWGTSGYNHGAICYQPWSTSGNDSDYYINGQIACDVVGNADWGYNPISNGGNIEGQWRTLTSQEWEYLTIHRKTVSGIRYVKASINNVFGIVLLPDNWDPSYIKLKDPGEAYNHFTEEEWRNKMESHGAVFLPMAGYRQGGSICSPNTACYYWTSTRNVQGNKYSKPHRPIALSCNDRGLIKIASFGVSRGDGYSVRLVYSSK